MDLNLDAQLDKSRQNEIIRLFRALTATYGGDRPHHYTVARLMKTWRRHQISNKLDVLIKDCIKQKFEAQRFSEAQAGLASAAEEKDIKRKSRSVLSLSLQGTDHLTPGILDETCDQLKSFLFAGHDTTSILLQWIFYELSRTPRVLNALRAEHDEVFGPDPDPKIVRDKLLSHGDDLMRRMSYTSAVIKEALRLYPPAGTARWTPKGAGLNVRLDDGRELCLDGLVIQTMAG